MGQRIISSTHNGQITLSQTPERTTVVVGGAQQSGPELNRIWQLSLERVGQSIPHNPRVLVLGLGAGGVLTEIHSLFPSAAFVAVEHDPAMVVLTRELRYFAPHEEPRIIEADAAEALAAMTDSFDLIIVDLFTGSRLAPIVRDPHFIADLRKNLSPNGIVLINAFFEPDALAAADAIFAHHAD